MNFVEAFNEVQKKSSAIEEQKGLKKHIDNSLYVPTKLALIMSEAVEALEWHRSGRNEEIGHDLADIILRTMDLAEDLKIDLATEVLKKMAVNEERAKNKSTNRY